MGALSRVFKPSVWGEAQAGEADPTLPFREALLLRNQQQSDLIRQQRQLEDDKRALQAELATKRHCLQKLQARHAVLAWLLASAAPGTPCQSLGGQAYFSAVLSERALSSLGMHYALLVQGQQLVLGGHTGRKRKSHDEIQ